VGVPWLFVILPDIGTGVISFTNVDKRIVDSKILPIEIGSYATTMPGHIGYLFAIGTIIWVIVGRVCVVSGRLIGIIETHQQIPITMKAKSRLCRCLKTCYMNLAYVHHLPSVLSRTLWYGHNLIINQIKIAIGLELQVP
jgi:hypothetical protein